MQARRDLRSGRAWRSLPTGRGENMDEERASEHPAWPLRAVFLLALGAATGLAIHFLLDGETEGQHVGEPLRMSLAVALGVAGLVFAFTVERLRWTWSVAGALAAGAVTGFVAYWNGSGDEWGSSETWQFASSVFAVAVAAPLLQSARDSGRFRFDYRSVHGHAWGNVVLWCASWGFLAIVLLLLLLLGGLFDLIGLDLLRRLMDKPWFLWTILGGALGAAIGLLRDRDKILLLLQRVVMAVLSVLAPILAFGLVFFLLALPFTGLAPLWNETKSTTPILLTCIVGAIVLANAVIGNGPEEEAKARPLRWSAMALAGAILPLAIVAAVSTGLRIGQYGLTPERLWAAVFVGIALVCALAYVAALVIGRSGWAERVRRYNIVIAIGLCLLALVLALPIVPFGALSVSSQVARLESGRVTPQRFDWPALRFEFGPAGVRALERLRDQSANADIRARAAEALKAKNKWDLARPAEVEAREKAIGRLRILPAPTPLPPELAGAIKTRVYVGDKDMRALDDDLLPQGRDMERCARSCDGPPDEAEGGDRPDARGSDPRRGGIARGEAQAALHRRPACG
ncbi:MAG: DUF4153 domain-containing protein [Alphaproteobacteria bacterium]|nr:MAG: DUF4153 domain-containing protein [Alphaproteobacteria bacterium]